MITEQRTGKLIHSWMRSPAPRVMLAFCMLAVERALRIFAHPVLLLCGFLSTAWLGLFSALPGWAHAVVLTLVVALFFSECGHACLKWRPLSKASARRRVERASGLSHQPLATLQDHPAIGADGNITPEQNALWREHVAHARAQTGSLKWPCWSRAWGLNDPYALRYAALAALLISAIAGRHTLTETLVAAINPAVEGMKPPPQMILDVWISPPGYTELPPIVLAGSSQLEKAAQDTAPNAPINVPEGSVMTAHVSGVNSSNLLLDINGKQVAFSLEESNKDGGSAKTTVEIKQSGRIYIRNGWWTIASWPVRVVTDQPPRVKLSEQPTVTARKSLRFAFEASDDYGVRSVFLHVAPRESLPGARNDPVELELAAPDAKDVHRTAYEDITSLPWAGLPVELKLVAVDTAGHRSESDPIQYILPERIFLHPLAQAIIEERHKLLHKPDDENIRNESANIMASIARQPAGFRGDILTMMGLRAAAVRIVLDRDHVATGSVIDMMWPLAIRIEDGEVGTAEKFMRQTQIDFADALDRKAGAAELHRLIEKMRLSLMQYLRDLSTQMATRPGPTEELSRWVSPQTGMKAFTQEDLTQLLARLEELSASGEWEKAMAQLAQFQNMLENLRKDRPQLSSEQREALEKLKMLRTISRAQKLLLDKTFQAGERGNSHKKNDNAIKALSSTQGDLARQMRALLEGISMKSGGRGASDNLSTAESAMRQAEELLQRASAEYAMQHQNRALKALQNAEESMFDNLGKNLFLLPEFDNFLERNYGNLMPSQRSEAIPERQEVKRVRKILQELQRRANDKFRPKDERDYLERLLQNF